MPGFGSEDMTLVDMELGSVQSGKSPAPTTGIPTSKFAQHKISYTPKVFEVLPTEYGAREESLTFPQNAGRRMDNQSETFIIGGVPPPASLPHNNHTNGTWLDQESEGSSIELHRLGSARVPKSSRPARRP
jgi:hypothetical protein